MVQEVRQRQGSEWARRESAREKIGKLENDRKIAR